MAKPPKADKPDTGQSMAMESGDRIILHVQGPPRGRWRAGLCFGPEPRQVEITLEQFEAINADPELKIVKPPEEPAAAKE